MLKFVRFFLIAVREDLVKNEVWFKIEGKKVFLRLQGACSGCPHAQYTLKSGIETILKANVDPEIVVERA